MLNENLFTSHKLLYLLKIMKILYKDEKKKKKRNRRQKGELNIKFYEIEHFIHNFFTLNLLTKILLLIMYYVNF